VLLVRRTLVGIAGRDRDADAEIPGEVEEGRDVLRWMAVVDRGVDVDGEALGLRRLDGRHRAVEYALLTDRLVVMLLEPVEMDREEEIRRRLEQMQLLLQEQRVGAQRHEFLARHDALDD